MDAYEFWAKQKVVGECWEWQGAVCADGYGSASVKGIATHAAHRIAYILVHGPTASSHLFVCHTCDNRKCVRPEHLFLGTALDNARDRTAKGRSVGSKSRVWFPQPLRCFPSSRDLIWCGQAHTENRTTLQL